MLVRKSQYIGTHKSPHPAHLGNAKFAGWRHPATASKTSPSKYTQYRLHHHHPYLPKNQQKSTKPHYLSYSTTTQVLAPSWPASRPTLCYYAPSETYFPLNPQLPPSFQAATQVFQAFVEPWRHCCCSRSLLQGRYAVGGFPGTSILHFLRSIARLPPRFQGGATVG